MLTLADMDGNETFDPSALGTADEVAEIRVADDAMVSHHTCLGHDPNLALPLVFAAVLQLQTSGAAVGMYSL